MPASNSSDGRRGHGCRHCHHCCDVDGEESGDVCHKRPALLLQSRYSDCFGPDDSEGSDGSSTSPKYWPAGYSEPEPQFVPRPSKRTRTSTGSASGSGAPSSAVPPRTSPQRRGQVDAVLQQASDTVAVATGLDLQFCQCCRSLLPMHTDCRCIACSVAVSVLRHQACEQGGSLLFQKFSTDQKFKQRFSDIVMDFRACNPDFVPTKRHHDWTLYPVVFWMLHRWTREDGECPQTLRPTSEVVLLGDSDVKVGLCHAEKNRERPTTRTAPCQHLVVRCRAHALLVQRLAAPQTVLPVKFMLAAMGPMSSTRTPCQRPPQPQQPPWPSLRGR